MIKYWETKDGRLINPKDMSDEHLENAYNLFKDSGDRKRLEVLEPELRRRGKLPLAEVIEEGSLKTADIIMTNELIKHGKTIYLCYQNPINHSWLVYDEDNKFSILTLEQVQDNKEGYVFKDDLEVRDYIDFHMNTGFATGFELDELIATLPGAINMMQFIRKEKED